MRVRASKPEDSKTFWIRSQMAGSSSTTSARLYMAPLPSAVHKTVRFAGLRMWRLSPPLPNNRGCWALRPPRNFITIKLNAHAQLAPWRIRWLHVNHVPRAQPFVCGLAGNFFGHFQKHLNGGTDAQRRIRREIDPSFGEILRFGPLLWDRGLPNTNAQRKLEVVTRRDTSVGCGNIH